MSPKRFKTSLSTTNFIITLVLLLVTVFLLGYLWIKDKQEQFEKEVLYLKQSYIQEKKTIIRGQVEDAINYAKYQQTLSDERLRRELKARINEAYDISTGIYNKFKGIKPDSVIKGFISEALRSIRFFNGRGYFYVYEMNGLGVMHGANPKFEGNLIIYNFTDAKGNYPLREIIKAVSKNGKGFVNFFFFRPNSTEQEPKLSYNRVFEPYDWVIGTGEYKREITNTIQKETIRRLRSIRYDEDGYLFIYNKDGKNIMHPILPEMEGKNFINLQDATGKYIFPELLKTSQAEEIEYVEYLWSHPGLGENLPKLSFTRFVSEWNWMIGSGLYMHQIDDTIKNLREDLQANINERIFRIILVVLVIFVVVVIILKIQSNAIRRSFFVFTTFFDQASTKDIKINYDQLTYNEFRELAKMGNHMLELRSEAQKNLKKANDKLSDSIQIIEKSEADLKETHKKITDSIQFASMIQNALLPDKKKIIEHFEDAFVIWEPKDVVGGDIFFFEEFRDKNEVLLLVIDCTGHGVPGALVTAIVKSVQLQVTGEVLMTKGEISPARILSFFNIKLKHLLKQEDKNAPSNAGFDGGVLYFNKKDKIIRFAGAETPLFLIQNHEIKIIKGNRHSIGYKKSDAYYKFTDHTIDVDKETFLYLTTDGFLDQNGGKKGFPYGKKQFAQLLLDHYQKNFSEQKKIYLEAIKKYQGSGETNDDMTFVGLKIG
jgi:signal transduction histidine kinase/serine phosphatase RsbU (regulator of sigma subunit)